MSDEIVDLGEIKLGEPEPVKPDPVTPPPIAPALIAPPAVTPARSIDWKIIAIIALVALLLFKSHQPTPSPTPGPDGQTIVIDGDTKPQPGPDTTPVVIGDAWLLVVYESEDNDANFISVYENKPYRDGLAARGLATIWQDQDTVNPAIKAEANQIGLPAVFILSKPDKKPITSFTLPAGGTTALDAELKKRVGK